MSATKSQEMGAAILRRAEPAGAGAAVNRAKASTDADERASAPPSGNVSTATAPAAPKATPTVLVRVALGKVAPSTACPNPRKHFGAEGMEELTASVKAVGILQPPLVRRLPKWELKAPDLAIREWRILRDGKEVFTTSAINKDGTAPGGHNGEKAARRRLEELTGESRIKSNEQEQEFELVAGERRWRAAKAAGLSEMAVLVAELTDSEVVEMQHIENLQREGLTPLEEAESFAKLIGSGKYTAETLAQKLGKDRTTIFNRLKLMRLSKPVRAALEDGKIDAMAANLLTRIPDPARQERCLKEALKGDWQSNGPFSFRDLRAHIEENYQRDLKGAKWNLNRVMEKPGDSCEACPKRSGNMLVEFPEFKGNLNLCTDLKCYDRKLEWAGKERLEEAKRNGQKVLTAAEYKEKRRQFQELSEKDWSRNGSPTLRSLIGPEQAKKATVAVDEQGEVHELMSREELAAALKAAGVKPASSNGGGGNAAWKRDEAKRRKEAVLRGKVERAALKVIRVKARSASGPKFWELLTEMLLRAAHWDPIKAMLRDRGLKDGTGMDRSRSLRESLKDEESLREAVVELLARETETDHSNSKFSGNLKAACAWAGVDLAKVERGLKSASARPQGKAKVKTAKGGKVKTVKKK